MKWIDVRTDLPKTMTMVLIYTQFGTQDVSCYRKIFDHDEPKFIANACAIDGVTHWMPLPEPPVREISHPHPTVVGAKIK